ncbi:MAG: iron ABC transporter permease [Rhodothermus sp.]|nr:iron ABC transporter permease [Rhodothermus sp.]
MKLRALSLGFWLLGLLLVSVGAGVALGSVSLAPDVVLHALLGRLVGAPADPVAERIVWQLRLPRVLMALLTGGGLAIVGVAMQALVRNPLAEPYILGLSSGASVGASLFYLGLLPPLLSRTLSMPLAAFLGALLALTLVYLVARQNGLLSITRLLLGGVAISALMASITSFITFASPSPDKLRAVLFWLLGSFSGARWSLLPLPALAALLGLLGMLALTRPMDLLLLGEEPAAQLGVPVERAKRLLIFMAALVTGTLVAFSGTIGFVGLIIPHAVRALTGVPHRRVVPLSFLLGAIFLIWADLAARLVLPGVELPVGVVTALCGVPFFLMLLRRGHYRFG